MREVPKVFSHVVVVVVCAFITDVVSREEKREGERERERERERVTTIAALKQTL